MLKKAPTNTISIGLLLGILTFIYLFTIAPDITWANNGSDGGDLITAVATGGIAHPSGYPLYLLVARVFQLLPIRTLAFRTNLMSVVFALLTVFVVYTIVTKYLTKELDKTSTRIAGLSAGFVLGLSPLFWSQAVITEVYTLHAFFAGLIIFLSTQPTHPKLDRTRGLLYGLAISNHLTAILFIPGALIATCLSKRISAKSCTVSIFRQLFWTSISGLFIYALLPLRAMNDPIINWGNPVNLENFWWLVSGKIYRAYYLQDISAQFWPRLQASANLLLEQFGLIGISLGFIGLIVIFKLSRLYILTIWNGLIFWIFTIQYQSVDAYVYFIPVVISFSIWIGLCIGYGYAKLTNHNSPWKWFFIFVLTACIAYGTAINWYKVDASHDHRAENFAREVLESTPKNAIIFAKSDQAVFTLWYFHFALGQRTDMILLATDLLHYDWYQESMKKVYPTLALPGPFPWPPTVIAANPTRDYCYIEANNHISCNNITE